MTNCVHGGEQRLSIHLVYYTYMARRYFLVYCQSSYGGIKGFQDRDLINSDNRATKNQILKFFLCLIKLKLKL